MNPSILILGKIPPPYYGPAIATKIILESELNKDFQLVHFDTRLNSSVETIGQFAVSKVINSIFMYFRFFKTLKSSHPDIVLLPISQSIGGFFKDSLYVLVSKCSKRKVLIHLRGSKFKSIVDQGPFYFKLYVKFVFLFCIGAIVLGNNLRFIFEKYFLSDRIFVVPNGANYDFPKNEKIEGEVSILYLSNLQPSKGILDFVNAIKCVDASLENVQFTICGEWRDDQTRKQVLDIVQENHFPVVIQSLTDQNTKLSVLKRSDLFVFPPRAPEGHPWVIVEALAAGLPIISTDQGAIRESVIDGYNGYIVSPCNPEQIAEKISVLIKNRALRKEMGRNSRSHYEANFTESKMVENLRSCFSILIQSE